MRYRLYDNGNNDTNNVLKEILNNRGINDYKKYLNLDSSVEIHYSNLDNIEEGVELFNKHYTNKNVIGILFDEDVDGVTSGSSMFNYIRLMDNEYPVKYILHTRAKAHGLSNDVNISDDIKLLIIPDAASNDIEQCKKLKESGVDILILDHHEVEKENIYATVINNQISNKYNNKALSGVGVVYKFLQALDDYYWNEYADEFLDLVALGLIGDVMDIRSFETRYLINKGIKQIKNKALKSFIQAQNYSMSGKVNIHNIQWYIVPVINAMIRIGTYEEKELLFKAFMEMDESFEYNKRASKGKPAETIEESIYDRAARLSKNAKARQDKTKEKCVEAIVKQVSNECSNDKVIIVDATDNIDNGLTGVVAIKIAEMFSKPCILLNKHIEKSNVVYGGSSRNFNNSPIENFKDLVNEINVFDFAQGHQSAFGIQLQLDKIDEVKYKLNNRLKDIVYESVYVVDYILEQDELSVTLINDVDKLNDIVGQGIDECSIAIESVNIKRQDIDIIGKNNNTISFEINDNIKCVKFNCKENDELLMWVNENWNDCDWIKLNLVGKPSINEFNGVKTPQIIIQDFQVLESGTVAEEYDEEEVW